MIEPAVIAKSVPLIGPFALTSHIFTAKRLHPAAQGQRRSRATLGYGRQQATIPRRGLTDEQDEDLRAVCPCETPLAYRRIGNRNPGCAQRSAATLGCGM